jgi:hypothetical protein
MPAAPPKASFPTAADQPALLQKLREWAMVSAGLAVNNRLDTVVTLRMLKDAGVINVRSEYLAGGPGAPGVGGGPAGRPIVEAGVDLTPPPVPGGFGATAGVTQILFETAAPVYRQGHGHARTKVYAAPVSGPLPTFADAVLYTDFPGNIGVAPFDPASTLRLWATWTSVDGKESEPAGGTNGIAAATGLLEDTHIANLAVGKLLAGSLSVGQYIQSADYVANTSGWRIQTLPGGTAFMEINGGALIGGLVVGADNIRSSNYVAGTTGYRFKSDGTGQIGGLIVTTNGVQSANYVAGISGFRWDFSGSMEARSGTFAGALAAATGTFAGALSAATGTFAGALSAATGTFAGALSAASGTFAGTLTAGAVNAVDTINIAGNAVTIPVSTSTSASFDLLAGGENTLITLPTFTSKGGQVVINFGGLVGVDDTVTGTFRVKRNGVTISTYAPTFNTGVLTFPPIADTPGNGVSTTYTITWQLTSSTGLTASFETRAAFSLETIR